MNMSKSIFALVLLVVATVNFADAACWQTLMKGNGCSHIFPNGTVVFYSPGESWEPAPCQVCDCMVDEFEDYFTCYMPAQPGYQIVEKEAPIFRIQVAGYPVINCPPGFQSTVKKGIDIKAQFFLTYQVISGVSYACCDNKMTASFIPEMCKPVRYGKDNCKVEAVLKEDETQPCPIPVWVKGR